MLFDQMGSSRGSTAAKILSRSGCSAVCAPLPRLPRRIDCPTRALIGRSRGPRMKARSGPPRRREWRRSDWPAHSRNERRTNGWAASPGEEPERRAPPGRARSCARSCPRFESDGGAQTRDWRRSAPGRAGLRCRWPGPSRRRPRGERPPGAIGSRHRTGGGNRRHGDLNVVVVDPTGRELLIDLQIGREDQAGDEHRRSAGQAARHPERTADRRKRSRAPATPCGSGSPPASSSRRCEKNEIIVANAPSRRRDQCIQVPDQQCRRVTSSVRTSRSRASARRTSTAAWRRYGLARAPGFSCRGVSDGWLEWTRTPTISVARIGLAFEPRSGSFESSTCTRSPISARLRCSGAVPISASDCASRRPRMPTAASEKGAVAGRRGAPGSSGGPRR